ncbi:rhamnosyltransferase WsaF family glycosyltransferase [Neiella marina]|nr:rhamnan synthesis F family protein [Neiella marina]
MKVLNGSHIFDHEYYNFFSNKPHSKQEAVRHYLDIGVKQGINPCEMFSTNYYLLTYPDVLESGNNPLVHFIRSGAREGRLCHPDFNYERALVLLAQHQVPGDNYLEGILSLINSGKIKKSEVFDSKEQFISESDISAIESSGVFDRDFYLNAYPDVFAANMDPLHHYLHFGFAEKRNPSLAFDGDYYQRKHMQAGDHLSPLLHYIRDEQRQPDIRPSYGLDLSQDEHVTSNAKLAIHIHLFYPDVLDELVPKLRTLDPSINLLVSTSSKNKKKQIESKIARASLENHVELRVVENIGRDIAPWFVGFADLWPRYDYVCHLHSKKSPHTHFGRRWRSYLFDQLIGSQETVNSIIAHFETNSNTGFMYPDNYHEIKPFVGWNGNEVEAKAFLNSIGFSDVDFDSLHCEFAAGSMCWVRTSAFSSINSGELKLEDFESENNQEEGTLAHVLERCLPIIPQLNGFEVKKFYAPINDVETYRLDWSKGEDFPAKNTQVTQSRWLRDNPAIALNERVALAPQYPYYNEDSLNIHWVIPDFGIGAGGHMTIFRMIKFLEEFGHRQTIWIQNAHNYKTPAEAKLCIQDNYQEIGGNVIVQFLPEDVERIAGDVIIATDCWTVFPTLAMSRFKERFYFIQDWEPMFHPVGDAHLIAQLTYKLGFNALCAGNWLHQKATEAGLWARKWDLATDQRFYYPDIQSKPHNEILHIAFYARAYTPRRAVMLGVTALKELHRRGVEFHVSFFGQDNLNFDVDFSHEYLGILSPEELGNLYREADIGMVFSATNYSLIPLEMMACALPVLELDVESTRAVFDDSFIEMASPDPLDIATRLELLVNDRAYVENKAKKAEEFSKTLSWKNSALAIESALKEKLVESNYVPINIDTLVTPPEKPYLHKAAVIIPTYNAGEEFKPVLEQLLRQQCEFSYEIVVVDSGSTDQTIELINSYNDSKIKLVTIPNSEFQHGRTRNFAISQTDAEFVAVITQDATPKDKHWLTNLVKPFDDERVAGVFGAHEAYPNHSAYVQRDIKSVFERFDMFGDKYKWSTDCVEPGSIEWQFLLQFYSDNNSCMRRSVWDVMPYPEIDWGEDQVWAWMIVQLGFVKAYAAESIVYHSHDDSYQKRFDTAKIEGRFFTECFGLKLYKSDDDIDAIIRAAQDNDRHYGTELKLNDEEIDSQMALIEASHLGRFNGNFINDRNS